jgi:DNA-binding GntR family transcriptional regulator
VGVSRTPVREALLLLEAEGLLRLFPKRGALVVPVSADEVRDVMETRLLVERHAVRVAAASGAALAAALEGEVAEQERRLACGDRAGFAEADRAFHRRIVAAAGNAILLRLYDSLQDRQRRMNLASTARDPSLPARFVAEHRRIAAALAAGDADAADAALAAHLETARAGLDAAGAVT